MTRKEELHRKVFLYHVPHNGFQFARILPIIHITIILLYPPSLILRHLTEYKSGEDCFWCCLFVGRLARNACLRVSGIIAVTIFSLNGNSLLYEVHLKFS
jgi:hypothetical protein